MTVEPQPAGPTFARSARVHDVRTYIYIYIYKKHIYIYDEDFSPLYDKCGARSARRLYIYDEDFSQLYDKWVARSARQLYKYSENSDNSTDKGGSLRSPINVIYTVRIYRAESWI